MVPLLAIKIRKIMVRFYSQAKTVCFSKPTHLKLFVRKYCARCNLSSNHAAQYRSVKTPGTGITREEKDIACSRRLDSVEQVKSYV